jgi:multiple sugar transport system substrate-binding protein
MQRLRALTWDHPRGYNALAAASRLPALAESGLSIAWEKQPLEGFESHPIADLCARYDLVVLDHPHVGEAVAAECLRSLEEVFGTDAIARLEADSIGPSLASYRFAGSHWALPLDAATQVLACRRDLMDGPVPVTWDEVAELSERTGKVAMSLAGPHAALSFLSIAAAFDEPPAQADPDLMVSMKTGKLVYELMAGLVARSPMSVLEKNPIGILGHMAGEDDVILCPLVYGYVNYAAPTQRHPLAFHNAPRRRPDGRPGSTLGGTGIGISRRCEITPGLKEHLLWLMSAEAQIGFIPDHEGQPSRRATWHDAEVNARWGGFYANTADTLEAAYVRPRHNGYIAFQSRASALLREALQEGVPADPVIQRLQALYGEHRIAGSER